MNTPPRLDSLIDTDTASPYEVTLAREIYPFFCEHIRNGWEIGDAEIDFFERYHDMLEAYPDEAFRLP